jgi:hypothetical protein
MTGNPRKQPLGNGLRPLPQGGSTQRPAQPTDGAAKPAKRGIGLLTPAEAAKRLGVGERVLERWRGTGDGPAYVKFTSRTLRYRAEDLEAFVSGSVRRNTAE